MWQWKVLGFIEKTKEYLFSFFSSKTVVSYYNNKTKILQEEIERLKEKLNKL